jgi:tRNA pseudouridine38-40 synthase
MQLVTIVLQLTYEGTSFDGWQDNLCNTSIEGALKKALFDLYQVPHALDAASRTDKGVHALSQVVMTSVNLDKIGLNKLLLALNGKLPPSIRVKKITQAPQGFHPSLSAQEKTYLYKLNTHTVQLPFDRHRAWPISAPLNLEAMNLAASYLVGQKNFSSFSNKTYDNPLCTLNQIKIYRQDHFIHIELNGNRFLYKMCRIIVGTLVSIGLNERDPQSVLSLFEYPDRTKAGLTAPSCGLYLASIRYDNFTL